MKRGAAEVIARLLAVVRKRRFDAELDEELDAHLDLLTRRNEERGMASDEARRRALLQLGGHSAARELHRDARGLPRLERLGLAFAQAWRSWCGARGIALLATLALAIGIGSVTAIYSVVNGVMLKPLGYRAGDRFVRLFDSDRVATAREAALSYRDAEEYQQRTTTFDAFGWFRETGKNLMHGAEPMHVKGVAVTIPLVHQLGVDPALGRWFDDASGVVISHALWRRLGSDPAIVGQGLTLDDQPYTVTGVMPASFHLPVTGETAAANRADVWTPLDVAERDGCCYDVYARRRPGVSIAAAMADVDRVAAQLLAENPQRRPTYTARVRDLHETIIERVRPTLLLLFAAAALLFLISCASAAGLLLSRSVARARETAMRVALGASRGRLALQYVAEGVLIALPAGAIGIGLSVLVTPAVVSLAADYLPRSEDIGIDWRVLGFALAAAALAGILASLAPLRQAAGMAPAAALGDGVRVSAGRESSRASRVLVVAEVALAFGLLTVSATLIVHVRQLARSSPGFDANHLLTFVLSVPGTIASDPDRRVPHQKRLVEAIAAIPGVEGVAFANQMPLTGWGRMTAINPTGAPDSDIAHRTSRLMAVSPEYFQVMQIPLRRGRLLTESDARGGDVPVVVNEAAVRRLWSDRDPLGAYGTFDGLQGTRFQIVGIVGDVKNEGMDLPTTPEVYAVVFPYRVESMYVVVRSPRPAASLVNDVRRAVGHVDAAQPVHAVATMREIILSTMTLERSASLLATFFSCAALLMATLGVYGVIAYAVRQRSLEIGMRMMLGASARHVLALVLSDGVRLALYGAAAGGIVAVGAAAVLGRVFDGVATGLLPYCYSAAIVVSLAVAASLVPALRASRSSPLSVLRSGS
ncbi:MAG TPA: ADOP family duplicated permease [Luteitalea sp.]|nr:ADOP family duplicated permease [Luteitalea sp.]